jgi:DNA-binding MarR family transcriptional regulator
MKPLHDHRVEAMQRLFAVGAALGPAVTDSLAAQRLTPARIGLVQRLHKDGAMSQRQLADALGCSARNVTGLVDATEALGLVQRQPHPTDRRTTLVSLTQAGENSVSAWQAQARKVAARVFKGLDDREIENLSETLGVVLSQIRTAYPNGPA